MEPNIRSIQYEDMTDEQKADIKAVGDEIAANDKAKADDKIAKDNLKASAKAKLIAGDPLTAEEADTIVL